MIQHIKNNYLENREYIGQGSEGIIFKKNKIATKIFNKCYEYNRKIIVPHNEENPYEIKKRKLLLLKDIIIEEKVNIKSLLYIENIFCGYNMDYFEPYPNTEDLGDYTPQKTLSEKIEILIKISRYLQQIHKSGIAIGDLRTTNICIDKHLNLHFVDTDGYSIGGYDCDCIPLFIQMYNCMMRQTIVDINTDKYSYGLMCLDLLTDFDVYNELNTKVILEYISTLELPKELIRAFRNLFSKDPKKIYIDEQLREIKLVENDRYVKIKKSNKFTKKQKNS